MNILDDKTRQSLIQKALNARENSYAPYSNYKVGAALLCNDGKVFTGCNIENAAYPCGICAERVCLSKAVSEGYRKFCAISIAGSSDKICTPCGMCRQALYEFSNDLLVICCNNDGNFKEFSLSELLLDGFIS